MHSARRASSSSSSSMINSINPDVSAQREQHKILLVPLRPLLTAHALKTLKPAPARLPRVHPSALCAASVYAEKPGTSMPAFLLGNLQAMGANLEEVVSNGPTDWLELWCLELQCTKDMKVRMC